MSRSAAMPYHKPLPSTDAKREQLKGVLARLLANPMMGGLPQGAIQPQGVDTAPPPAGGFLPGMFPGTLPPQPAMTVSPVPAALPASVAPPQTQTQPVPQDLPPVMPQLMPPDVTDYQPQIQEVIQRIKQSMEPSRPQLTLPLGLLAALAGARYGVRGLAGVGQGVDTAAQQEDARRLQASQFTDIPQLSELLREKQSQESRKDAYTQAMNERQLTGYQQELKGYNDRQAKKTTDANTSARKSLDSLMKDWAAIKDENLSAPMIARMSDLFGAAADRLERQGLPESQDARKMATSLQGWAKTAPQTSPNVDKVLQQIDTAKKQGMLDETTANYILANTARSDAQTKAINYETNVAGPVKVKLTQSQTEKNQAETGRLQIESKNLQREYDDKHAQSQAAIQRIHHEIATAGKGAKQDPRQRQWVEELNKEAKAAESEHNDYLKRARGLQEQMTIGVKGMFGDMKAMGDTQKAGTVTVVKDYLDRAAQAAAVARKLRGQINQLIQMPTGLSSAPPPRFTTGAPPVGTPTGNPNRGGRKGKNPAKVQGMMDSMTGKKPALKKIDENDLTTWGAR